MSPAEFWKVGDTVHSFMLSSSRLMCMITEVHSEHSICGSVWTAVSLTGQCQTAPSTLQLQRLHVQMEFVRLLSNPVNVISIRTVKGYNSFSRSVKHVWMSTGPLNFSCYSFSVWSCWLNVRTGTRPVKIFNQQSPNVLWHTCGGPGL